MYPILWAMKHAPCADVYEQAVLIQMADAADEDGCNAYLARETIADRIAGDINPETVRRKWRSLERRGLIRPDTTPPTQRYLKIPKNRRPKRWELCIPYSWWSDAQREQVQRGREDRGLPPLTPDFRPDLADAPPKRARADKGTERPDRRRSNRGVSETPREAWGHSQWPQADNSGGTHSGPQGALTVAPRGHSQWPNPPLDHPQIPSSPPAPPVSGNAEADAEAEGSGREDESSTTKHDNTLERAQALVDSAVRCWKSGHRAPTARDRQRLSERVRGELDAGGDERLILDELTRDLGDVRSAVSVVLGARTATPGWGRSVDPRPEVSQYEITGPKPPWCGRCDERTRHVVVRRQTGGESFTRCECHPERARGQEVAFGSSSASEVPPPPPLEELAADLESSPAPAPRPRGGPDPSRVDLSDLKASFATAAAKYQT